MKDEERRTDSPDDERGTKKLTRRQRWKKSYREWRKFKEGDKKKIFEREYTSTIIAKFILPFAMAFVFSIILYILFPDDIGKIGELFVLYFFNPAGMEVGVIWGIAKLKLDPLLVVTFMLVIDSLTAIFLIMNFNYSRLLPFFGWLVWGVQAWAEKKMKKSKSFERGSFIGVIIFVFVPLYGTGAILGGIVGKLLYMDPWKHFVAILIGSSLRLSIMAITTVYGLKLFEFLS